MKNSMFLWIPIFYQLKYCIYLKKSGYDINIY